MAPSSKLVLGMMSGTSADGIDAAVVKISGAPPDLKIKLIGHVKRPFPGQVRSEILRVAEQNPLTPGEFSQLHARLGKLYAEAAIAACAKLKISRHKIDLIGNHGQTVFHQGLPTTFLGAPTASTLQIGDGSVVANLTGITTVSDFRPADIARGGQGAPLVPFADYVLYRDKKLGRISLNIGGIANITVIPADARPSDVFAFDTGPGNMLIDALVEHFTHGRQRYDRDARLARRGRINPQLMRELLHDPYFDLKPPKSTGREYFGRTYVKNLLALGRRFHATRNDMIRTATAFAAASIADAIHRFVLPKHKIQQLIVSGGGSRNRLLCEHLSLFASPHPPRIHSPSVPLRPFLPTAQSTTPELPPSRPKPFPVISVLPSSHFNVPVEAKEALAFAILAYETFHQRPSNLPSATGASGPAILGKLSYALPK